MSQCGVPSGSGRHLRGWDERGLAIARAVDDRLALSAAINRLGLGDKSAWSPTRQPTADRAPWSAYEPIADAHDARFIAHRLDSVKGLAAGMGRRRRRGIAERAEGGPEATQAAGHKVATKSMYMVASCRFVSIGRFDG
jgi:hypothetical protein